MIDKRCVVILGAGASKPFGVPLASELLPKMLANSSDQTFKNALAKLRQKFNRPAEGDPDLEEILTIIKILEFAKDIPELTRKRINLDLDIDEDFEKNLYLSLKKLIYDDVGTRGFEFLHGFFRYCEDNFSSTTWCSFNWDCILEASFYDFGESTISPHSSIKAPDGFNFSDKHSLLKLHGGVNLWRHKGESKLLYLVPGKHLSDYWKNFKQSKDYGFPAILEPSGFKYQSRFFDKNLEPQWNQFKCELKMADAIIIIGYSLPDLDPMAKEYLESVNECAKVIVFDIDDAKHEKYKKIFGEDRVAYNDTYGNSSKATIIGILTNWYNPTI